MVFSSKLASSFDSVSPCYRLPRSIYFLVTVHAKGTAVLLAISWPLGRGSAPSLLQSFPENLKAPVAAGNPGVCPGLLCGTWYKHGLSVPGVRWPQGAMGHRMPTKWCTEVNLSSVSNQLFSF